MLVSFYNLGSGYYASSPAKLEMLVPTRHPGSHGDSGELQSWKLGAHRPISEPSALPFPTEQLRKSALDLNGKLGAHRPRSGMSMRTRCPGSRRHLSIESHRNAEKTSENFRTLSSMLAAQGQVC